MWPSCDLMRFFLHQRFASPLFHGRDTWGMRPALVYKVQLGDLRRHRRYVVEKLWGSVRLGRKLHGQPLERIYVRRACCKLSVWPSVRSGRRPCILAWLEFRVLAWVQFYCYTTLTSLTFGTCYARCLFMTFTLNSKHRLFELHACLCFSAHGRYVADSVHILSCTDESSCWTTQ